MPENDMWLLSFDASARDLTVALKRGDREFARVLSPEPPQVRPSESLPASSAGLQESQLPSSQSSSPGLQEAKSASSQGSASSPQGSVSSPQGSSASSQSSSAGLQQTSSLDLPQSSSPGPLQGPAPGSKQTKKSKQASRQESVSLLIPTIDQLLCEAKIKKSDLGALVVGIGPGGFTGVRVAVVTARTLSQIMKLPLVSINSLEAAALESFTLRPALQSVVVLKSASRTHVYLGVYERVLSSETGIISDLKPVQIPTYLPLQEGLSAASQALLPGGLLRVDESLAHHFAALGEAVDRAVVKNIALTQAKLGELRLSLFGIDPYLGYESCQPLYLRGASVTLKSGNAIERIESH